MAPMKWYGSPGAAKILVVDIDNIIEKWSNCPQAPSMAAAAGGRVTPGGPGAVRWLAIRYLILEQDPGESPCEM